MANDDIADGLRLDKWLWFARFYKSRSSATDAVSGGRVHINGARVKPSRPVSIGDTLSIMRDEIRFEVIVQLLPTRRGPAPEAQSAYAETDASVAARAHQREQIRLAPSAPLGRPDKHERRALRDLRGRH